VHYAATLALKGHYSIVYLTFNKSAADEASERFTTSSVQAKTLHSQAFACIGVGQNGKLLDDSELNKIIEEKYRDDIDQFLSSMPLATSAQKKVKKSTSRKVAMFIRKTLEGFFHSKMKLEDFKVGQFGALYYPAKLYHQNSKRDTPEGVPKYQYEEFYISRSLQLWAIMSSTDTNSFHTFDSVMKQAQLYSSRIDCTALLVDESQDMNGCQIAWIAAQQQLYGTHVFLVGDPVQSIYSFRGAKSQLLMELPNCLDKFLTVTHRFGPEIAAVANSVLHCKELSPQTVGKHPPTWLPYRLVGGGGEGRVTAQDLLPPPAHDTEGEGDFEKEKEFPSVEGVKECEYPVTVLAFANMELMEFALTRLLGICKASADPRPLKIAINGSGEFSGPKKWLSVKKTLQDFYKVYAGESTRLPYYPWDEDDKHVTWEDVCSDVESFELTKFVTVIQLIDRYRVTAVDMFLQFEREVLNKKHSPTDPDVDVVLSTIHAAKGMEWGRVLVLDASLSALSAYTVKEADAPSPSFKSASALITTPPRRPVLPISGLDWLSYGDNYNLWYVALTRAKSVLCVPPKYMDLVEDMRNIVRNAGGEAISPIKLEANCNGSGESVTPTTPSQTDSGIQLRINGRPAQTLKGNGLVSLRKSIGLPWVTELREKGGLFVDDGM
jgi:hypothetical protein